MKKYFIVLVLFNFAFAKAQNYWQPLKEQPTTNLEYRKFIPENYQFMQLDINALQQAVSQAPKRFETLHSNVVIAMPDARGVFKDFEVFETLMMETPLYNKYPQIRTYIGFNTLDQSDVIRFSITPHGFHNIEFIPGQPTVYIDPLTTDHTTYMIYDRSTLPEIKEEFECLTDEMNAFNVFDNAKTTYAVESADDGLLRTYRIAISCNAEYGNIFAGTGTDAQKRANIQAQQVITMNRVNGVYERDLAITMIFVANNDVLLYFGDVTLDPYTNDFNTRTQNLIDGNLAGQGFPGIGNANYDIGHNFNTSGGGNAGCIGCVCTTGQKGSGMTGQANPTGDPFDIDYVAHEIGHQFGGYHSMASSGCRSGSGQTEVEPGSGSTIMAYAGICAPNVQNNSDDYFHYVNVRDITANIQSGVSSSCAVTSSVSVSAPIANAGNDYIIPKSTAFVLTGTASNLGSNTVTYNWEQNDPENPNSSSGPDDSRTVGPMYRSKPSVTVPERYFPPLSDVVQGNLTPDFEVTPAVARSMEFAFTVRKYDSNVGQNDADLMNITVDGISGPFQVTSQDTNVSYNIGDSMTVTWDVAGTDQAPINTTVVDILLSTDGGVSFPTVITSGTANDGSQTVSIPVVGATNQARIMVKAQGNVYYAVNSSPFSITANQFSLTSTDLEEAVCLPGSASYDFTYRTFNGFTESTTLSLTGAPAGATVTITPSVVMNDNTPINVSITGLNAAMIGSYNLVLQGAATSVTRTFDLTLDVLDDQLAVTILNLPQDNEQDVILTPSLEWNPIAGAQEYDVEVATDVSFTTIVSTATVTGTVFTPQLLEDTTYYWRVKSRNVCGDSSYSTTYSFKTAAILCLNLSAADTPITISSGLPSSIDSFITITDQMIVDDLTVTINISHTWMSDVDIYLTSPQGTQITLVEDRCGWRNDLSATFSDAGIAITCSNNPAITGVVLPVDMLNTFIGEDAQGDWKLSVGDDTDGDGGNLNSWSIDICGVRTLSNQEIVSSDVSLYPNPASDVVTIDMGNYAFAKAQYQIYDMAGRFITDQAITDSRTLISTSSWSAGMYIVRIEIDEVTVVKQLIKE